MKISKELDEKLEEIYNSYMQDSREILLTAARESNPYKAGDIIKTSFGKVGRIKAVKIVLNVERRRFGLGYKCEKLTTKLEPYKNPKDVVISLNDVVEKINKK